MDADGNIALSDRVASDLLAHASVPSGQVAVEPVATENHVWLIRSRDERFFLKTHTKDWYSWNPILAARLAVRHESAAYALLAQHSLPTPEVVMAEFSEHNPLGRPYLLLRALDGEAFVGGGRPERASPSDACIAVGDYLRRMHAIRGGVPGFIGLPAPDGPDAYRHPSWTHEAFTATSETSFDHDGQTVERRILAEVRERVADADDELHETFRTPVFIHGDCHASQFFLRAPVVAPEVSGVIDMEVASWGNPLFDFMKLFIEIAGRWEPTGWWDDIFTGYGAAPDFRQFVAVLLGSGQDNFTGIGAASWPGTWTQVLAHILAASDWETLLDLHPLRAH